MTHLTFVSFFSGCNAFRYDTIKDCEDAENGAECAFRSTLSR